MRLFAFAAAPMAFAAVLALPRTSVAQEIIVAPPPGYGVTIIPPYPDPPPPAVVTRPAPPAARYYESPGVYASYRSGGCGWLYRRAVETGSSYWWSRYEDCSD